MNNNEESANEPKARPATRGDVRSKEGTEIELVEDANEATHVEHTLSVKEAFETYPMAVVWSMLFCVCIIMDGYDSDLMGNFFGLPSFQRRYGSLYKGAYYVPARWQTALNMASPVGRVVGGGIQGLIAEPLGRKKTLILCLVLITGFIFIPFYAKNDGVLMAGEMLCGIMWGILSSLAPTYASEIVPLRLRGILTAFVNLCWSIGQLIASGVAAGMQSNTSAWSYRLPFAIQWIWPVLILSFIYWAPESPYWLIRHGKLAEAEASLRQVIRKSSKVDVKQMLALMERTNLREQEYRTGSGYMDCFKGTNLRRTEISAMAWAIQILSGLSLPFYAVVFFELAGFPTAQAFDLNVGLTALGFFGTCCSFFIIPHFGRRTLYFGGLCAMTLIMLIFGFLGIASNRPSIVNAEATLLMIWFYIYYLTVGPVAYIIFSETSATRLRGHTVAIAMILYSILGIIYNVASPYFLDNTELNWGAKTGLVYGGISLVIPCVWCYFRLPECKDRTFEELDIMFERKVPTRQFKDYVVEENM